MPKARYSVRRQHPAPGRRDTDRARRCLSTGLVDVPGHPGAEHTGLERRITSYDGALLGEIGLLGNGAPGSGLAAVAQVGNAYEIHLRWSRRSKLAALKQAIRRLPRTSGGIVDTSMSPPPTRGPTLFPYSRIGSWPRSNA